MPGEWQGLELAHVGAYAPELELNRYLPRPPLTRLLRGYDLVQVVVGTPSAALCTLAAGKPTTAFIATLSAQERVTLLAHQTGPRRALAAVMTRANTWIERYVLRRLDHVFAESAYTSSLVSNLVREERLSVSPPGVDTDTFTPGRYAADGYILSVGRLADPRKNVRLLFEAYARLVASVPTAPRLVLAGQSKPSEADWAHAQSLGIADRIDFHFNVSIAELADLFRGASLFVLSSDEEGLGIVILEAMASGVPVVATRCGGPDSIVRPGITGELVPVRDRDAMARAMATLVTDPGARTVMARRAREICVQEYSLKASADRYLSVFRRLLSPHTGTPAEAG